MQAPLIYRAFLADAKGATIESAFEFPLFTDARIIGELSIGPLTLLNPVFTEQRAGFFRPAIVVRCRATIDRHERDLGKTNTDLYHGGSFLDEVAALISLTLGFRVRAGQVNREFSNQQDQGRPRAWDHKQWPESRVVPMRPILPYSHDAVTLGVGSLNSFAQLHRMQPGDAAALVKAARSYQDALWIGEWEPEQAWLQFVSAIEAAATRFRPPGMDDTALLFEYDPQTARKLREYGGDRLVAELAPILVAKMGATRKFCEFIIQHFPDEPSVRPTAGKLPWSPDGLKPMLKIIYDHRSRALHGGTPFPAPMCLPPADMGGAPSEVPIGLAMSAKSGVWRAEDTPMLLHPFAHLVAAHF